MTITQEQKAIIQAAASGALRVDVWSKDIEGERHWERPEVLGYFYTKNYKDVPYTQFSRRCKTLIHHELLVVADLLEDDYYKRTYLVKPATA